MLVHAAYFEKLASIKDDNSPQWKSTLAGLAVLRVVDNWLDLGAQVVTTDITGLRAVGEAIHAVSEGNPIRTILQGITTAIQQAEVAQIHLIASNMLAYGRALHYAGEWHLSHSVFADLLDRAQQGGDTETAIQAALRLGFVARRIGDLEASSQAYELAEREAQRTQDLEGCLRARLGFAQNTITRGNLPQADQMLASVAAEAQSKHLPTVVADALHARAHLCHTRQDYATAVRLGYSALEYAPDALARDRILGDIAASFAELGHLAAAQDANLIIAASTQEEWLRQQAMVNLLHIAVKAGHQLQFEHYRNVLTNTVLQPYLRAYYHLFSGEAFKRFGSLSAAVEEFQAAIAVASVNNLNQVIIAAEDALSKVEAPSTPGNVAPAWPVDLDQIAVAIGEMRELTTACKMGVAI